jgi:Ca-activated chloride channel family protein
MSFLHPEYFWLLLFLLAAFLKRDFEGLHLRTYGYIVSFILIIFALARPVVSQEPTQTKEFLSDVVLAVDLSYSMQAQDIKPTRLAYAKEALTQIVRQEKKSRFGVLGFTTNAIILSPLTQDSELLLHLFGSLDETLVMTKGSAVMPALELGRKMSKSKRVSLVLLSDGADELNYADEATYAKQNNIIVNVLMIATKTGGTLQLDNKELLKDELGDIVVSRENEAIMQISDATGGVYTHSISEIQDAINEQREDDFMSNTTVVQYQELFYYFVALAIIVFLVSVTSLKRFILIFLLLFGIEMQAGSLDFLQDENIREFKNATQLYKAGEYEKALVKFQNVHSNKAKLKAIVFYNIANTFVRLKEFDRAKEAYIKSLTLDYSKEAADNLHYIKNVAKQKQMSTGQQKTKERSQLAKKRESSTKKKKNGGSSNMNASAKSSDGAADEGKKAKAHTQIDISQTKTKLSSKQYELINARRFNEKHAW